MTKTVIRTETEDGLQLDGLLLDVSERSAKLVCVWLHGFGANFYFPPYLRVAEALAERGHSLLVGNTRGHDYGTLLEPKGRTPYLGGSAWERLTDSVYDIAAWVDCALGLGFAGVALAGHSVGAVKVTAYQASQQDARVLGLALLSPPLRPSWDVRSYPEALAQCAHRVAQGRAEELFDSPWGRVSAQTFLSYDEIDFDQFGYSGRKPGLARVRCAVLAVIGSEEPHVAVPGDLDVVRRHTGAARLETHVIAGADHFYTGHEREVAAILAAWIEKLS